MDPERHASDESHLILGEGALGIRLPADWRVGERALASAMILPGHIAHASLKVDIASYEDPVAVAADDMGRFIEDEVKDLYDPAQLSGAAGFIVKGNWLDQSIGCQRQVWRVVKCLFPDHVRVATYTLDVPLVQLAAGSSEALTDAVEAVVESSAFGETVTALDRIAPTETLKRVSLWNLIHMRVPADWTFTLEKEDGASRYRGEPEAGGPGVPGAFWVDFEEFRGAEESRPIDRETRRRFIEELAAQMGAQPSPNRRAPAVEFLENGDGLLSYQHDGHENGANVRVWRWYRFTARGPAMIMGMFSFIAPADTADEPPMRARARLLDREIRNALIGGPDPAAPTRQQSPAA